jgi:glycerate kinase
VHDPLERPIEARFVLLDDGETAVVDTAQASGLHLTSPDERDPERATTRGTGELLAAAIDQGARRILIAAGGSATTDGGIGAIEAIERGGGLQGARLDVLCDVDSPFERAADTFGPQKGADPETIKRLTTRLHQQAAAFPRNPIGVPMTGCAGGLSGGLWAVFDARLRPGADYVFQILNLPSRVLGADAVISGEGRLDPQSFDGKVVGALTELCRTSRTELHVIVGTSLLSPSQARQLGLASLRVAGTLDAICAAARQIAVDCHTARDRPS